MKYTNVTFCSTKMELPNDYLTMLCRELEKTVPAPNFRFSFEPKIQWNKKNNAVSVQAYRSLTGKFAGRSTNVIYPDDTFPAYVPAENPGSRIRITFPFNRYFGKMDDASTEKEDGSEDSSKKQAPFTHLLATSPLMKDYTMRQFQIPEGLVTAEAPSPAAVWMNRKETADHARELFLQLFPFARDRKIGLIDVKITDESTIGALAGGDAPLPAEPDPDRILFLNSRHLAAALVRRGFPREQILVSRVNLMCLDLMPIADILVTNKSRYVTDFLASGKTVRILTAKDENFGQWMEKHYPALCIDSLKDPAAIFDPGMIKSKEQEHERLRKEFSFPVLPDTPFLPKGWIVPGV